MNSSYFGFDETISDINQAVSVLGIGQASDSGVWRREGEIEGHRSLVGNQGSKAIDRRTESIHCRSIPRHRKAECCDRQDFKVAQENSVNAWETETEMMQSRGSRRLLARPLGASHRSRGKQRTSSSAGQFIRSFVFSSCLGRSLQFDRGRQSKRFTAGGRERDSVHRISGSGTLAQWNQLMNRFPENDGQDPLTAASEPRAVSKSRSSICPSDPKIEAQIDSKLVRIFLRAITIKKRFSDDWESDSFGNKT